METTKGFVYIMINPSYGEGLVKIGKTTKDPEERAKELSSSTGVATPFIVVYKKLFKNCHLAERLIHELLDEKGYRVNTSREFFAVSISDAINYLLQIPDNDDSFDDNLCEELNNNEDNDLAEVYYNTATQYANGTDDTFQDYDKAILYYERSANLGKVAAYRQLGMIWKYVKHNADKALECFHYAVDNGDWINYADIASLYGNEELRCYSKTNQELAWRKYFENLKNFNSTLEKWDWQVNDIGRTFIYYLYDHLSNDRIIPAIVDELAYANKSHLEFALKKQLRYFKENNYESLISPFERKVGKYIHEIEEKILLSTTNEEEIAVNYFTIALKYYFGEDDYEKNEYKALLYFKKSAKLGYDRALIYVGLYWLTQSTRKDNAAKAWNEYYNAIYDKVVNETITLSEDDINGILGDFYMIFQWALSNNSQELIHEYYCIIAMHLDIFGYMDSKMENMVKISEELSQYPDEFPKNTESLSTEEFIEQITMFNKRFKFKTEFDNLNEVFSYLRDILSKIKNDYAGQEIKMYKIED